MLNNKGFAVSTVLYTLLIAFLMFLGAALAQFSSSSSLIGKSTDDLVNGNKLRAEQVKAPDVEGKVCGRDYRWFQNTDGSPFNTLVRINSKYGTMYWPKDFGLTLENGVLRGENHDNKNIRVVCLNGEGGLLNGNGSCNNVDLKQKLSVSSNETIFNYVILMDDDNYKRVAPSNSFVVNMPSNVYSNIKENIDKINDFEKDPLNKQNQSNSDACYTTDNWAYYDLSACTESYSNYYNDVNIEHIYHEFLNELKNNLDNDSTLDLSESILSYNIDEDGYLNIANILYYKPVIYVLDVSYNSKDISFDKVIYFDMVYDEDKTEKEGKSIDREALMELKAVDKVNQIVFYNTERNEVVETPIFLDEFNSASKLEQDNPKKYENAHAILRVIDLLNTDKSIDIGLYDICS